MASDREYQKLLDKYNFIVAKCRGLEEQLATKRRQWDEKFEGAERVDSLARGLCEEILARDKKEMVLGVEYTWNKISTDELLVKAMKSLKAYDEQRMDVMRHLLDKNEERSQEIESLREQIDIILTNNKGASAITREALEEQVRKEKENEKEKQKASYDMQKKAEDGHIQIEAITTENSDGTNKTEEELIREVMMEADFMSPMPNSIPVKESQASKKQKSKIKNSMDRAKAHVIDLREHIERMTPLGWSIIDVIGTYGTSVYKEIETHLMSVENAEYTASRIRSTVYELGTARILNVNTVNLPLKPKFTIIMLSDIGQRLYKEHNDGKTAVVSECEKIIAEHDNLEHGYGIMEVVSILKENEEYIEVCASRRENTMILNGGLQYIPDVICKTKKHTHYIEYERGTHTQADFNAKCNKMLHVTRYLNFIVPNRDIMDNVFIGKVQKWIESRGRKALNDTVIRISTFSNVKKLSFTKNDSWTVVFMPGKSSEPIIRN